MIPNICRRFLETMQAFYGNVALWQNSPSAISQLYLCNGATRPSRSLPRQFGTFSQDNYLNSDLRGVVLDYMRLVIFCPHAFNPPRQPKGVKTADTVSERWILIFRMSHTDSLLHQPKVLHWNPFCLVKTTTGRPLTKTTKNGGEGAKQNS